MKVLHLIGGKEIAGSKNHLLSLLQKFHKEEVILGVFEKGCIYDEAQELGIDVRFLGQQTRYDFSVISKIKNLIEQEGVSILHTHGPRANFYGYFIRKKKRVIWTTTVHSDPRFDFIGRGLIGKVFTLLNLTVLKKVDHCFAISERFAKLVKDIGVNGPITTIYNGISFNENSYSLYQLTDVNVSKDDFILIMVGRLHPIKGHEIVLEAINRLKHVIPSIRLWVVGDGPLREELQQKVKRYQIERHVRFLGYQPEEKIHSLLKLSNVFVLASHSESFPLVVLEASRAKIPVISTDVGGVRDLITDQSLGWLIPPNRVDRLEKAIYDAYERKDELDSIGHNLYNKAATKYSVKQLFETVYVAYSELHRNITKV